jgi:hypothetical protein
VAAEVDDIIKKVIEEFKRLSFFRYKGNTIARVIQETPEEISYITQRFRDSGLDKVTANENDFLLGTVISFIYYKTLLYCSFEGNRWMEGELPEYQSQLFSSASMLKELIIKVIGK